MYVHGYRERRCSNKSLTTPFEAHQGKNNMSSFLGKQYGLIISGKKAATKPVVGPSAFGDSSSDEVRCVHSKID